MLLLDRSWVKVAGISLVREEALGGFPSLQPTKAIFSTQLLKGDELRRLSFLEDVAEHSPGVLRSEPFRFRLVRLSSHHILHPAEECTELVLTIPWTTRFI